MCGKSEMGGYKLTPMFFAQAARYEADLARRRQERIEAAALAAVTKCMV